MIDHPHSIAATNLVAIDIAKDWNLALIQDSSGRRQSFKFANRFADHNEFVRYLHSLPGRVCIGLEPTGDYHRAIAHRLLTEGFDVVSISSLALARFREALRDLLIPCGEGHTLRYTGKAGRFPTARAGTCDDHRKF